MVPIISLDYFIIVYKNCITMQERKQGYCAITIPSPLIVKMAAEGGPLTISVEEIVREFFIDMKKELNTKRIADVLYAKGLIDYDLKKKIDVEANQVDANELLLDHLIRNGTLETLRRFCEVLEETANSQSLPHHRVWSNKLKQKLTKVSRLELNRISPYSIASAWCPDSHTSRSTLLHTT